ncbi:hypothetical protein FCJ61_04955 [Burkholderia metallica]|uniref:hypothetical protein n=1 Tax=Burkholderia metallica TaxID=488729 RepID=UPI00157A411B|nr:hypothetical protein [Burkholderia metallica]NTZ82382.1 hypothetical protein [Burkholderia metallica]
MKRLTKGPVVAELLTGMRRIRAECRRLLMRVNVQRQLRRIDQDERRALHDIAWMQRDLDSARDNLARLQVTYANRRRALHRRLRESAPDLTGGGNAAA